MDLSQAYASMTGDLANTMSLLIVALAGLALVVFDAFKNRHAATPWIAGLALTAGFVFEVSRIGSAEGMAYYNMLRTGGSAAFVNALVLGSGVLSVILTAPYLKRIGHNIGEAYSMILFATVGMLVLGSANNLVTVFVGLETMSICLYILTGFIRSGPGSTESAFKYFLLGAFSTGFFLYGIALLYGATGTMDISAMRDTVADGGSIVFWAGVAMLLVGFLFKVSAAPFHMWTPDVYQGAPTTITGFMSTASKTAAFASLILILNVALPGERWSEVLAVFAVITMVLGNVIALSQSNIKRMLAYSSIAHAGYILVGLAAGSADGYSGALFYLMVYTIMNIGAFGVIALLEWDKKEGSEQTLDSLAGIGYKKPLLGWTMAVFMFSLAGFPPLGGFLGKWAVFAPAVEAGYVWLAIVGVLTSAVSAYYYLRVLVVFFMKPEDAQSGAAATNFVIPKSSAAVLIFCVVLLFLLGVTTYAIELTGSFF
ncbi:MAG: NADH-quinone oxidoreductase subunit N [Bacteroidetes bacterium]|nr:NADH-quinone oxidoreductase subunit N [Bacteroidota bacterium]